MDSGRDLGPELFLARLCPPQGTQQVLELVVAVPGPQERLTIFKVIHSLILPIYTLINFNF